MEVLGDAVVRNDELSSGRHARRFFRVPRRSRRAGRARIRPARESGPSWPHPGFRRRSSCLSSCSSSSTLSPSPMRVNIPSPIPTLLVFLRGHRRFRRIEAYSRDPRSRWVGSCSARCVREIGYPDRRRSERRSAGRCGRSAARPRSAPSSAIRLDTVFRRRFTTPPMKRWAWTSSTSRARSRT